MMSFQLDLLKILSRLCWWEVGAVDKTLVCDNSEITQNVVLLSYGHHPKAKKLLCRQREIGISPCTVWELM